jgi:phosphatidylglycerophosphatase A
MYKLNLFNVELDENNGIVIIIRVGDISGVVDDGAIVMFELGGVDFVAVAVKDDVVVVAAALVVVVVECGACSEAAAGRYRRIARLARQL